MELLKQIKRTSFLLSLLTISLLLPLSATTVNISSASGVWQNAENSSGGTPSNFSGAGTNSIHWGNPASGNQNSGYLFNGNAPLLNVALDTPFAVGTFTHFNYPITGSALASVELNVNVALSVNGSPVNFAGTYNFLHNETPNNQTQADPNCCNDIVSFQNNVAQLGVFNIGGVNYTIGLLGFKTSANGSLFSQFSTVENQQNVATLYAQISSPSLFVPEPTTYLLLGSFLFVIVLYTHRRRIQTKC